MTRIVDMADSTRGETAHEFEGYHYGDTGVSFIVIDAPPGGGPKLHRHPYGEIFVVQEGSVTFTAGDEVIEAGGGQVVVVPAGVPHRFVNSGAGRLRRWTYTRANGSSPNGSKSNPGAGNGTGTRRPCPGASRQSSSTGEETR